MKYIIAATAVTDEICLASGEVIGKSAGGAGIYALCGLKLWCDDVLLVTGVGSDYRSLYEDWYEHNGISMEGLSIRDDKTPHTIVQYFEDGERVETPVFGNEHYQRIESKPEDLEPYFGKAKGIYIFKNSNSSYWETMIPMKKKSATVIMWEIANDATYFANRERVKNIAQNFEIFSINLTEASDLLGKETLDDIIDEFRSWGLGLVYLRRGSEGAVLITPSETVYAPAVSGVCVVDPTGGGNSSSGAVLYGFCEGYDLETCGNMGSKSAAMCISQYGVPWRIEYAK